MVVGGNFLHALELRCISAHILEQDTSMLPTMDVLQCHL